MSQKLKELNEFVKELKAKINLREAKYPGDYTVEDAKIHLIDEMIELWDAKTTEKEMSELVDVASSAYMFWRKLLE